MYKKIFIPISIAGAILFTGCGADTSPVGAIEKVINDKQLNSQKDIAKLIGSFYKRATISIKNTNCGKLKTNSENIIDLSIIELANKFCKNPSGLKKEMKKTISIINTNKVMNIKFSQIDTETLDALKIVNDNIENLHNLLLSNRRDVLSTQLMSINKVRRVAKSINRQLYQEMKKFIKVVKNPYGIGYVMEYGNISVKKDAASLVNYKEDPQYSCELTNPGYVITYNPNWIIKCINFHITDAEKKTKYKKGL